MSSESSLKVICFQFSSPESWVSSTPLYIPSMTVTPFLHFLIMMLLRPLLRGNHAHFPATIFLVISPLLSFYAAVLRYPRLPSVPLLGVLLDALRNLVLLAQTLILTLSHLQRWSRKILLEPCLLKSQILLLFVRGKSRKLSLTLTHWCLEPLDLIFVQFWIFWTFLKVCLFGFPITLNVLHVLLRER